MTTPVSTTRATLKKKSKSFYWAGLFLSPQQRDKSAQLYYICRQIDDIADSAYTHHQRHRAKAMLLALKHNIECDKKIDTESVHIPLSKDEYALVSLLESDIAEAFGSDRRGLCAMHDLIDAMLVDVAPFHLQDEQALLRYAYGAAGTVGIMMSTVLKARQPDLSTAFAVDLGIAMQMTNIARDVLEDAERGRVYLPQAWMNESVSADAIARGDTQARAQAWQAVRHLIQRAERYYRSGYQGLAYLPLRARLAIGIALRVYRQIGRYILQLEAADYWSQRAVIPYSSKWVQSAFAAHTLFYAPTSAHDDALHEPISDVLPSFLSTCKRNGENSVDRRVTRGRL